MDEITKRVFSFYLDLDTVTKLDALAAAQRRNRSTQIAFMIDEAFARLFPTPIGAVDSLELGEKGSGS